MKIVHLSSDNSVGVGTTSMAFLHDPTNPTQKNSAGREALPPDHEALPAARGSEGGRHIYGMMAAYAMVDALKHAGRNPTRAGLLRAAQHLNETNPFLLPGLKLTTTPKDYFPLGKTYLVRYQHGYWNVLGKPSRPRNSDSRGTRPMTNSCERTLSPQPRSRRSRSRGCLRRQYRLDSVWHTPMIAGRLGVDDDSRQRPAGHRSDRRREHLQRRPPTRAALNQAAGTAIGTVDATALSRDAGLTLPLSGTVVSRRPVDHTTDSTQCAGSRRARLCGS